MRICSVVISSRSLLGRDTGGAEKQIALLARTFARRGHRVTLLVTDHVGPDVEVDGVALKAAWDPRRGVRRLRAVTYRYPSLARRLLHERADLYYVRGAVPFAPLVMRAARHLDSPGFLGLAHDRNLTWESGEGLLGLEPSRGHAVAGYAAWLAVQRHALRLADVVVAQSRSQAGRCAAMGLPHVLIPSIVEAPPEELLTLEPRYDVVWVGNVHREGRVWKNLGVVAALAAAHRDVRFAVVGDLSAASLDAERRALASLPNVALLGAQPYAAAQRVIAAARLVLNTSPAEGFSNVMLEGWALARPSLTLTVNPNGLLDDDGLGRCAGGSVERLGSLLRESLSDEAWAPAAGRRAQEYVRAVHGADQICSRYEQLAVATGASS